MNIERHIKRFHKKNIVKKCVIVAGLGRCGTTVLSDSLVECGFRQYQFIDSFEDDIEYRPGRLHKTHALPPDVLPDNVKLIYMIGNVMDMVISAHKKINQWGKEHHFHLNSSKFVPNNSVFEEDTMELAKHFDVWYRKQNFSFMTIHYDVLFEKKTAEAIGDYLGTSVILPEFKQRETDWRKHSNKAQLVDTYGSLHEKVEASEKIKIWL